MKEFEKLFNKAYTFVGFRFLSFGFFVNQFGNWGFYDGSENLQGYRYGCNYFINMDHEQSEMDAYFESVELSNCLTIVNTSKKGVRL